MATTVRRMGIVNGRQATLICALGAMSESLVYTALAPLLDQLDGAEGFNHEQAGLLVAGYAIGYWLGSIPAYRLVALMGARAAATLGIASVALATLLFAYGDNFPVLMGARVLVGTGSVLAYSGVLTAAAAVGGHAGRGGERGVDVAGCLGLAVPEAGPAKASERGVGIVEAEAVTDLVSVDGDPERVEKGD